MIEKRENAGIRDLNDGIAFLECSSAMNDVYEDVWWLQPKRKRKTLIVLEDMITDIMTNEKFQAVIKGLFIRCRKWNISQSYFSVLKDFRFNITHYYLIKKINNVRELQNIAINHYADIDYKDFVKIYRECTKKPFSFLTTDTILPARDPLRFTKNLFLSYKNDSNWSNQNFTQKN